MYIEYLPYIAAIVMTFSYVPQIIKILKTKSAGDLSFVTWCTWIVFMGIMALHAYAVNDLPFMISQGGQVFMLIFVLCLMIIYRRK